MCEARHGQMNRRFCSRHSHGFALHQNRTSLAGSKTQTPVRRAPPKTARERCTMKARVTITPKRAVLDPQGKAVQNALEHMGYSGIGAVHVGKFLEIELADGDIDERRQKLDDACRRFLSNPVIEDYRLEIE